MVTTPWPVKIKIKIKMKIKSDYNVSSKVMILALLGSQSSRLLHNEKVK